MKAAAALFLFVPTMMLAGCRISAPEDPNQAMAQMVKYGQKGKPEVAIKVAEDWLSKHPNETAHKSALYEQMAITYLIWASKDNARREELVGNAAIYYEREILERQERPVDLTFYNAGRGFENAGDLSTVNRCVYYGRAVRAFEKEAPYIQGESYTAYGKTIPLAPVRGENEKSLERVKSKYETAGCKAWP